MGGSYSVKGDVWSLGLTLMELALGRFPLVEDGSRTFAIFELLNLIVNEPVPGLPKEKFSTEFRTFVSDWFDNLILA